MKSEAEQLLSALVGMPTLSDDVLANEVALDYIEAYLTDRGMHVRRFMLDGHGALVATVQPGVMTPRVLLNAHVDVMAADESMFTLREEGDKLTGRGTYDMKFAIAAYMCVVDEIQDNLSDYDFGVMITTDEEYGGRDGISGVARLVEQGYLPGVCILPDGGTDWDIETLAKGHWRFDLTASGKAAHGSRPWEGDSASFKLIHALNKIKKHFKRHGPLTDTLNIGTIQGGLTYNQVPDSMVAGVEIRLANRDSFEENQKFVEKVCRKYDVTYQTRAHKMPLEHDIDNPYFVAFKESVKTVTGRQPKGCISYGISDANFFANRNIPCILTRPEGGGLHGPDEWISREEFLKLAPILKDYLDRTAKTASAPVDTQAALV